VELALEEKPVKELLNVLKMLQPLESIVWILLIASLEVNVLILALTSRT
jgi:hypothetical protein